MKTQHFQTNPFDSSTKIQQKALEGNRWKSHLSFNVRKRFCSVLCRPKWPPISTTVQTSSVQPLGKVLVTGLEATPLASVKRNKRFATAPLKPTCWPAKGIEDSSLWTVWILAPEQHEQHEPPSWKNTFLFFFCWRFSPVFNLAIRPCATERMARRDAICFIWLWIIMECQESFLSWRTKMTLQNNRTAPITD